VIATLNCSKAEDRIPAWHPRFLVMVPAIRRTAEICFRKLRPDLRHEMVQEVIANASLAYWRLVERGREHLAYPSALARFAIAQVRHGRQVGNRLNVRDVSSRYAQQRKGFHVERLDQFNEEENCWQEIVVEDKKSTPADIAITRIDFADWLGTMPALRRKIAQCLATGESTFDTARRFALSPARISQLRREFQASWQAFHGEQPSAATGVAC
jgi:hypothetical protein